MFNLIEFIYDYVRMILSVKVFMNGVIRIWFYIFRLREILNLYFIFTSGGYSGIAGYMKLPSVAARIKRGEKLKSRYITQFEKIITLPFNPVWVKKMHVTEPFCTTDKCIGCGKCARVCPLNRITMVDKKPEWEGNCAHCMGCIANCPVRAIEYGDITKGQKMYKISNYVRKKYL